MSKIGNEIDDFYAWLLAPFSVLCIVALPFAMCSEPKEVEPPTPKKKPMSEKVGESLREKLENFKKGFKKEKEPMNKNKITNETITTPK